MDDVLGVSYIVLWAIVALQGFLLLGALRQVGLLRLRVGADAGVLITPEGLGRGVRAPAFETHEALTGRRIALDDFRGRRLVLLFLSPTCTSCKEVIPHFNAVFREHRGQLMMLAVCYGTSAACAEFARLHRIATDVAVDYDRKIAASYDVAATPFAYLVDEHGLVRIRGIANDWTQFERLLDEEGTFQTRPWIELEQPPVSSRDGAEAALSSSPNES